MNLSQGWRIDFTPRDRLLIIQAWQQIPSRGARKETRSSAEGRTFTQWLATYREHGVSLRELSTSLPITPQYVYLLVRFGHELRAANAVPPTIAGIRSHEIVKHELPMRVYQPRDAGPISLEYIVERIRLYEEQHPDIVIDLKLSLKSA